ncbi:unnamed protein product [Mytilus coruscus]|uniref:Uncharacterized protein n=1 Tax=Mytilus coruscus TaxID=42192 RepID=A0A6J8CVD1_MYTCO|nr:unnamed protein product [Mytilus coruscus]
MKVFENEKYLQSLVETNRFNPVDLICKVDPWVLSIVNSLKNFGSIEIKTKLSNICLIRAKDKQAQLQVTPTKTIKDLKLVLENQIRTDGRTIRGCCMSVHCEYFFTDQNSRKKLNVIASDGTFKYDMLLDPNYGFDIAFIDERTIAITSGNSLKKIGIDVIDTESRKKIKFISLPGRPYGITRDHDSLFVCVEPLGIYKVNLLDYTSSHVISCYLPALSYVSVINNKIYYTNIDDHSVVCCDRDGSRVWTFKDTSVLETPRDITVDNDGNLFVVGETSSNVVIISNDGKHHRQILTDEDGLRKLSTIFFDKQTRKLLVANKEDTAFLNNVS